MRDGDQFRLALECLDNLVVRGNTANLCLDLRDIGAVRFETVGKRVCKVAAVQHDLVISIYRLG